MPSVSSFASPYRRVLKILRLGRSFCLKFFSRAWSVSACNLLFFPHRVSAAQPAPSDKGQSVTFLDSR